MYLRVIALAGLLLASTVAHGAVFSDNFDAESGGTADNSDLNYTTFANWTVTAGTVDLIGPPGPNDLLPGNGLYVDMDGSTAGLPAGTITSVAIPLTPGDYVFSYDVAGSQRTFGTANNSVTASIPGFVAPNVVTPPSHFTPFTTHSHNFSVLAATSVSITFAAPGPADFVGVLLDNVKIEKTTTPIPEASTVISWTLMGLSGLGLIAFRRRR